MSALVAASPSRRVLGDKSTNASVLANRGAPKAYVDYPWRSNNNGKALNVTPKQQGNGKRIVDEIGSVAGQKRRIEQVDGVEEQEQSQLGQSTSMSLSATMGQVSSNNNSSNPAEFSKEDEYMSSMTESKSTPNTMFGSFHASQECETPLEPQFEIQEEVSQQTLERMHATPLPQNTSQLQVQMHAVHSGEKSQDSVRMSSFIDFDLVGTDEEDLEIISPTLNLPIDVSKESLDERAEMLRTRLQLALYKVQTNQISKPFSRLQKPHAVRAPSPTLPSGKPTPSLGAPFSEDGDDAVARARIVAANQTRPAVRALGSIPMPNILPTAYSARYMQLPESNVRLSLSSTPGSSTPKNIHQALRNGNMATGEAINSRISSPAQQQQQQRSRPWPMGQPPATPVQLLYNTNSPSYSSGGGGGTIQARTTGRGDKLRSRLTSSVVKGEAANGLLELMRAAAVGAGGGVGDVM